MNMNEIYKLQNKMDISYQCSYVKHILRDSNNLFTLKRGALGANILYVGFKL